jgi:hypothetical protein
VTEETDVGVADHRGGRPRTVTCAGLTSETSNLVARTTPTMAKTKRSTQSSAALPSSARQTATA